MNTSQYETGLRVLIFILVNTFYFTSAEAQYLTFPNVGNMGIFDPSLENGPTSNMVLMSYSAVDKAPPTPYPYNDTIQTRIAVSLDNGTTWADLKNVNRPYADINRGGTWVFETSEFIFDPYAPVNERFKVLYFTYLLKGQPNACGTNRQFQNSWIEIKTSKNPSGPWSAPKKLMAAAGYDPVNDSDIRAPGAPEKKINELPGLESCDLFGEVTALAQPDGIYFAGICLGHEGQGLNNPIVLIKKDRQNQWSYLGSFAGRDTAANYKVPGKTQSYNGFSAPDLSVVNGKIYLSLTPTIDAASGPTNQCQDTYSGCMIFLVSDLNQAKLFTDANSVPVKLFHYYTGEQFHGACSYASNARNSGLLLSQTNPSLSTFFNIFKTQINY